MPLEERSRNRRSYARSLDLPPPFRLVVLREAGDAFQHARRHAAELGAGTLVFVGRFDLAEFAVVLEPEQSLRQARLAFYAGMVALSDAVAAQAPPEKPMSIAWPDALHVDKGLIGGGRLGWPEACAEDEVPDWLVFGGCIRTVWLGAEEAGLHPLATTLAEEGFGEIDSAPLTESFARHLMVTFDRWQEVGFAPVARDYLAKLERNAPRGLDDDGNLLLPDGGQARLAAALAVPSWLDPATGAPRA
jgi:biotin-(acetyl-CoA carboxylase) ligase